MAQTPKLTKPQTYKDAQDIYDAVFNIYEAQTLWLRSQFKNFTHDADAILAKDDGDPRSKRYQAFYPYVRITTKSMRRLDTRRSYGFVSRPGTYETTLTRPDIYKEYYLEQFRQIIRNHDVPIEVGVSKTPIPVHFALGDEFHLEGDLSPEQIERLPDIFDVPNLDMMNDEISNSTYLSAEGQAAPLSLFTAPRTDISLQRLRHYTGNSAEHFQKFVIFTNYQFYIDEFIKLGAEKENSELYTEFVKPTTKGRLPQMPAYHLKAHKNQGITMVNIGVGPSNAKTITDHIAVLRPHAWLMLGHCAGLRNSQALGDYVLAHGYLREDNILDVDLPPFIPIPALAEIQKALETAVGQVTESEGYDLKKVMRTGTVATTDDRNWELHASIRQNLRLSQSRAIAMDMESGTIAANGFRFRVPYGTLLCVSDKPLHGQLKLPGMADTFYRERVKQHLAAGLLTMQLLRETNPEQLHSRKLRSFSEVAFQ